jgi:predicted nucleotidyltransferase
MDRIIHKYGLLKGEASVMAPFVKEPWREFTISRIKEATGKRSHHYVFEALKKFSAAGLLVERKVGNTNTYSVNFSSDGCIPLLSALEMAASAGRDDIPVKNLERITSRIRNPFFSLVVCGSYAEGKQKKSSDLDIAIIIPDGVHKGECKAALREGEITVPEVHGLIFTAEELYLMLTNNEFNYGKELARKHIIIYGAETYYKILFRAMMNGFKG